MFQLIEFLFNNIFVLVFLFGLVSYFLQKRKGAEPPPARPGRQQQMPPFGGGGQQSPFPWPGAPAPSEEYPKRMVQEPVSTPAEAVEAVKPVRAEVQASVIEPSRSRPQARSNRQSAASVSASTFQSVRSSHAVQGMMWAEVFGAPRSKKPHPIRARSEK